jgi:hypothetical protein
MAVHYGVYRKLPGIVLGFHGCDKKVGEAILSGKQKHLTQSSNLYDWLGTGIYFWENDPRRAMEFAQDAMNRPILSQGRIKTPFVIGAAIDLGLCMNLLDRTVLAGRLSVDKWGDAAQNAGTPIKRAGTERLTLSTSDAC